jgi:hypothetical protein
LPLIVPFPPPGFPKINKKWDSPSPASTGAAASAAGGVDVKHRALRDSVVFRRQGARENDHDITRRDGEESSGESISFI